MNLVSYCHGNEGIGGVVYLGGNSDSDIVGQPGHCPLHDTLVQPRLSRRHSKYGQRGIVAVGCNHQRTSGCRLIGQFPAATHPDKNISRSSASLTHQLQCRSVVEFNVLHSDCCIPHVRVAGLCESTLLTIEVIVDWVGDMAGVGGEVGGSEGGQDESGVEGERGRHREELTDTIHLQQKGGGG